MLHEFGSPSYDVAVRQAMRQQRLSHPFRCRRSTPRSTVRGVGVTDRAKSGTFAVLASAALFGTTGTVLVNAPDGADAWSVGALRLLVGAITLVAIAFVQRQPGDRRPDTGPTAFGAVGVAVFQLGYFLAVERCGVAVGTVVTIGSGPALSGIATAVLHRRRPSTWWVVGTVVGVLGVVLLGVWGGGSAAAGTADAMGIGLAVAAGAGWATFAGVCRAQIGRGVHSTATMAAVFSGGALLVSPVLVAHHPGWALDGGGPLVVAHLGVLTVGVAYWSYGYALRHLATPTVITLTLLEPITAAVLGRVVVGELVRPIGWAGIALVVVGLLITGRSAARGDTTDTAPDSVATVPA
jgi:DME family drug/metabolite transporter